MRYTRHYEMRQDPGATTTSALEPALLALSWDTILRDLYFTQDTGCPEDAPGLLEAFQQRVRTELGEALDDAATALEQSLQRLCVESGVETFTQLAGVVPDATARDRIRQAMKAVARELARKALDRALDELLEQIHQRILATCSAAGLIEEIRALIRRLLSKSELEVFDVLTGTVCANSDLAASARSTGSDAVAYLLRARSKEWVTESDKRVCTICLGNKVIGELPLSSRFPSGHPTPPAHPGCRCWLRYHTGTPFWVTL